MKKLALVLTMLALPVTGFSASQELEKCISEEQYALAECHGDEYGLHKAQQQGETVNNSV